ncbi:hypothetical protein EOD39_12151 [Acipenser ruthenus]|uniref:Uncharacterized protein n=1 Tax=Acipenser ruthenus TaxID=7906 RepID=A0A444UM10_ACIRT|nr:hypothetical protein EOD39_12151 [Acipenser ruthenus]
MQLVLLNLPPARCESYAALTEVLGRHFGGLTDQDSVRLEFRWRLRQPGEILEMLASDLERESRQAFATATPRQQEDNASLSRRSGWAPCGATSGCRSHRPYRAHCGWLRTGRRWLNREDRGKKKPFERDEERVTESAATGGDVGACRKGGESQRREKAAPYQGNTQILPSTTNPVSPFPDHPLKDPTLLSLLHWDRLTLVLEPSTTMSC